MKFDDYHRTVIGYHGTGLSAALRIVNRIEGFRRSERGYDWLGDGIYFWEYAPRQALSWAKRRQARYAKKARKTEEERRRAAEPLAVVACMIRLGFCLDLTEPEGIEFVCDVFQRYRDNLALAGLPLPANERQFRRLDYSVFEYVYESIESVSPHSPVDTARGIYVPAGGTRRVWDGSWISKDTHIQLCVRNPASILGTWLHHPTKLGVNDVREAIQDGTLLIDPPDPQSS